MTQHPSSSVPWDLVIFDHDGVLVDSEILSMTVLTDLMGRHGIDISVDHAVAHYTGLTWDETMDVVLPAGSDLDRVALQAEYHRELFARFESDLIPLPGITELLDDLTAAGVPVAVGSAASQRRVLLGISSAGIAHHFPEGLVLSRDHVPLPKPSPDVFELAAQRAGVPAERCLVIDDSPQGVEAAHRAGMKVAGLAYRTSDARLAQADWLVDSVDDLRPILFTPVRDISAILWDLDGTLVDSEPMHFEIDRILFAQHGAELTLDIKQEYIGRSLPQVVASLAERLGVDASVESLLAMRNDLTPAARHLLAPFEPTHTLALRLADLDIPQAIASGASRRDVDAALAILGLDHLFDVRVTSDEVRVGKPAPDTFLAAAERLGVDPDRCLVIEDTTPGLLAAKAAGMTCVLIPSLPDRPEADWSRADVLVSGGMADASANDLFEWISTRLDPGITE